LNRNTLHIIDITTTVCSRKISPQAQLDYEASRRRRREYIQEPPASPGLLGAATEGKLVVDRNCNASVVSVDKLQNEVEKSPKRRATRRGTDDDQAARASTGDIGE
jgi:50S ribosomal subunit-associated GTPase HflX